MYLSTLSGSSKRISAVPRLQRIVVSALALALLAGGYANLGMATAAHAEDLVPVPETGSPGMISLSSSVYPLVFPLLEAGQSFSWQIGVTLEGARSGESTLQLTATGSLSHDGGYQLEIDKCPTLWAGTSGAGQALSCPLGDYPVVPLQALSALKQGVSLPLDELTTGTSWYLRATLRRPLDAGAQSSDPYLHLGVGIFASGDDPEIHGGDVLSTTGAQTIPFLWLAGGLLTSGGVVVIARRRKGGMP
ncbi:hypothetical protein [Arthrobacter sp. GMC3]|uniref:hypothetical protein n=1 Tax=Arthrobacter sp. GMC3 TaxID=2058894 RepID=UPI000CE57B6E|nr:hypothetical protein [Arthrobacter sp. GMC3]